MRASSARARTRYRISGSLARSRPVADSSHGTAPFNDVGGAAVRTTSAMRLSPRFTYLVSNCRDFSDSPLGQPACYVQLGASELTSKCGKDNEHLQRFRSALSQLRVKPYIRKLASVSDQ